MLKNKAKIDLASVITRVLCEAALVASMQTTALATHTTNQSQSLTLLEGQK